jgi:hypothetical protein
VRKAMPKDTVPKEIFSSCQRKIGRKGNGIAKCAQGVKSDLIPCLRK